MSGLAFLLFAMQAIAVPPSLNPAAPPLNEARADRDTLTSHDPPTALIDFLGRRQECALSGIPREEQERYRCAGLPGEERAFRARFAADDEALYWLDQPPLDFRLRPRLIAHFDETEMVRPRRLDQNGVDRDGRAYRLSLDSGADAGRSTRIAVSYGRWPERSFTLSNREFPWIDTGSLQLRLFRVPGGPQLIVRLLYGDPRTYCGEAGEDSRERIEIVFRAARVTAEVTRRTNCQRVYETIRDAAAR